jgi:hypothetical protein
MVEDICYQVHASKNNALIPYLKDTINARLSLTK